MRTYLTPYSSAIPVGQRLSVETKILELSRQGRIRTAEEADVVRREAQAALAKGEKFEPSFTFTPYRPTDELSSERLNRDMASLGMDLEGLTAQAVAVDGTVSAHEQILLSDVEPSLQGLRRITETLLLHRTRKLNTTWNDIRVVQHSSNRNESLSSSKAYLDADRGIVHSGIYLRDRLQERRGPGGVSITVESLSGGITSSSHPDFSPERAIDPSPSTFWAELALSDEPITTTYGATDYSGVLYRVAVDLHRAVEINRINLLPVGEFPVEIVELQSRQGSGWVTIVVTAVPASLTWQTFQFAPVIADAVRLVVRQAHFRPSRLMVPRSSLNNQLLWEAAADQTLRLNLGDREDSLTDHRDQETENRLRIYLDALGRLADTVRETPLPVEPADQQDNLRRIVESSLSVLDPEESGRVLRILSGEKIETAKPQDLIEVRKLEYLLGLAHLEILKEQYRPVSHYSSPRLAIDGTLSEVAVNPTESHVGVTDGSRTKYYCSIEYEVETAPNRIDSVLPYGTSKIYDEVVPVDIETGIGYCRFSTADTSPLVRIDGVLQASDQYGFNAATRQLTMIRQVRRGETVTLTYAPSAGQDLLNIDDLYDSTAAEPEVFFGTDGQGRVRLSFLPYTDYRIVNDTANWHKDPEDARWFYRPGLAQTSLDGRVFGQAQSTLSSDLTDSATSLTVADGTNFTTGRAVLKIGDELIRYDSRSGNTFSSLRRGYDGTAPASHVTGLPVIGMGEPDYRPVKVWVDGRDAINLTDYRSRQHPAFTPSRGRVQFLQLGRDIIFSDPLPTTRRIEVNYRWLTQYVQLHATFRSFGPGGLYTATISDYQLLMNVART